MASTNGKRRGLAIVRQATPVTREVLAAWETKFPALKALNDATLGQPRGFVLPRERAWEICGGKKAFQAIADKWKRGVLGVRGVTVEQSYRPRGYRFATVEHHLTERHEKVMCAMERKHRDEALRLGVIHDADLGTDHNRKLRALLMGQHADTAGKINSQREYARVALLAPETMPRVQ